MLGDEAPDESPTDALERFNIETFNVIIDTTIQSTERRFRIHEGLYASISYFDPRNFDKIMLQNTLPDSALEKVSTLLKQHFPEIQVDDLRDGLISLANNWSAFQKVLPENYQTLVENESDDLETGHEKSCKNCMTCVYTCLLRYNMYVRSYPTLFAAYNFLLTTSVTQVACERSFSKLKHIKTKYRNLLTQEHLEGFMMMCVEKDILVQVDPEKIINHVANKSQELSKLSQF